MGAVLFENQTIIKVWTFGCGILTYINKTRINLLGGGTNGRGIISSLGGWGGMLWSESTLGMDT